MPLKLWITPTSISPTLLHLLFYGAETELLLSALSGLGVSGTSASLAVLDGLITFLSSLGRALVGEGDLAGGGDLAGEEAIIGEADLVGGGGSTFSSFIRSQSCTDRVFSNCFLFIWYSNSNWWVASQSWTNAFVYLCLLCLHCQHLPPLWHTPDSDAMHFLSSIADGWFGILFLPLECILVKTTLL